MVLKNVPLAGPTRKSASSYTSNASMGTHGMRRSQLPIIRWAIGTSSPAIVQQGPRQSDGAARVDVAEESHMKYSLSSIPIEALALAFIEFVFVSAYAAALWYVLSGK